MNRSVRKRKCENCENAPAEVLITDENIGGEDPMGIVCYSCSDCSYEIMKEDGYRETPIHHVDPNVVEVEIKKPDVHKFIIKKKPENTKAWLRMDTKNVINDIESNR